MALTKTKTVRSIPDKALGPQVLKNATWEVRIYKILKNGSPGVHLKQGGPQTPVPEKKVSPFASGLIAGAVGVGDYPWGFMAFS